MMCGTWKNEPVYDVMRFADYRCRQSVTHSIKHDENKSTDDVYENLIEKDTLSRR